MHFTFKCDSNALDFVGTLKRRDDDVPEELLQTAEDVALWFQESGIVGDRLRFDETQLERALELREAVWGVVTSHLDGSPLPKKALAAVNEAAAAPDPVPQLAAGARRISASPEQAMSAVARDAIEILTGPSADLIKQCSLDGCTQVYVDRSRGARREWCSMDPCGNRAKAREYRARKRASA